MRASAAGTGRVLVLCCSAFLGVKDVMMDGGQEFDNG